VIKVEATWIDVISLLSRFRELLVISAAFDVPQESDKINTIVAEIPAPSTPSHLIKKRSLMRGGTGIHEQPISPKWAAQRDWSKIFCIAISHWLLCFFIGFIIVYQQTFFKKSFLKKSQIRLSFHF